MLETAVKAFQTTLVLNQILFVIPKPWVMEFVMNSIMDLSVTLIMETAVCQMIQKAGLNAVDVIVTPILSSMD